MSAFTNKKKGEEGEEEPHTALLEGRLTESIDRAEDIGEEIEELEEEEESELERARALADEAESTITRAKKKPTLSSSSSNDTNRDPKTYKIGTPLSFYTNAKTDYADAALTKKPLVNGLKQENLSPDEQFNMKGVYIEKAVNNEKFPVGIKIDGVNGESLNRYQDEVGQKVAYVLHPGEEVAYGALNNGLGRKLGGRDLDEHGQVHIKLSADELKKFATVKGDGTAIIDIDFTSYSKKNKPNERTTSSMNPLAKVVVANARALLSADPRVRKIVGDDLNPVNASDKKVVTQFQTFKIDKKPFSDNDAQMQVLVDEASLDNVLKLIKQKVAKTAAKTHAKDYTVSVVRLNRKPTKDTKYGDITGEHQVTGRDIDAANAGNVASGVHITLNHQIHHPNSKK